MECEGLAAEACKPLEQHQRGQSAMAKGMCSLLLLLCIVGSCELCHASTSENYCYDDEFCPEPVDYDTRGGPVAGKLNVHLVPHTHDDVGWLKTVDQYYVGSNNSIQFAAVQYILDSVILALQEDPNRKFIYVEQAFFQRWWREQSKHKRMIVKGLVEAGQLEFINGGWCMHDEASTHYIDMIDQTTLGHRYIKKLFNKVPRIGWQIDPFGHSAIQAYLLGAEVGFDAVFFGRADYQDIAKRRIDRTMEFVWQGSRTLGSTAQILGGILISGYYAPSGFYFEVGSDDPIQDNPLLYDVNVQERVDSFVKLVVEQGKEFRTNHIMWTMGGDFNYEDGNTWFKQIDKLIHYVNKDGRVNAFYSTPSIYVDANHAENVTWPLKLDDFFPYADCPHCYWTGYFTSRPALKRYVRQLSAYLQVARQLEFLIGKSKVGPSTDALEEAMAVAQHHDAVSGTEKQHVASDYAKRLALGASKAEELIGSVLSILLSSKLEAHDKKENSSEIRIAHLGFENRSGSPSEMSYSSKNNDTLLKVQQCSLLNISYCPPTEADIVSGKSLVVVAYNSLGWARAELIRIPVTNTMLEVKDSKGHVVPSQLIPLSKGFEKLRNIYINNGSHKTYPIFWLVFNASVPPLGYNSYFVTTSMANNPNQASMSSVETLDTVGTTILESHDLTLSFSGLNGQLMYFENHRTKTNTSIQQSYCWYNASDGNTITDNNQQASGAYIFRPNSSTCFHVTDPANYAPFNVIRGTLVDEIHQEISPWVFQIVRLSKASEHVEIEFVVGPIPYEDGIGKELVTKIHTNISSVGEFYTDSNGRDFLKRVRNYRSDWNLNVTEPVAGNYYPVNLGLYLKDDKKEFSLLVDRALGGSSLTDGELEVMLHRRLLHDDGRGVGEALNESICINNGEPCEGLVVQGQYFINIDDVGNAAQWRRTQGQKIYSPLQLAFAVTPETNHSIITTPEFSSVIVGYELPPNIAIITLQELNDKNLLLRLAHLYEANEDAELSQVVTINLESLFAYRKIDKVSELSLSANQLRSEMKPLNWKYESGAQTVERPVRGAPITDGQFSIEIAPMEIKTFNIKFKNDN